MFHSTLEELTRYWPDVEDFVLEYNYMSRINSIIDFYNKSYSTLVNKYREKSGRSVFTRARKSDSPSETPRHHRENKRLKN